MTMSTHANITIIAAIVPKGCGMEIDIPPPNPSNVVSPVKNPVSAAKNNATLANTANIVAKNATTPTAKHHNASPIQFKYKAHPLGTHDPPHVAEPAGTTNDNDGAAGNRKSVV